MDATNNFRRNLRKILKHHKYTLAEFAEKVDMDVSKIQRMQDINQMGAINIDDADKISTALSTTIGYMCGNAYTDYMLDQTKLMADHFRQKQKARDGIISTLSLMFEADSEKEDGILRYLDEILDSVDSLHKRIPQLEK
jgi:transcriptional regulator with XRE-family HTH domain